ncbi:MAG: DNA polymerase III subunit beta, partial [Dermatophilaceae bacterium]
RGLPARPPVPVLAGVLLVADAEGTITLSAFDYEVSAKITIPADVDEPGTVLVLGRLLGEICRNLPSRPIEVATTGNKIELTCGASRFSLLLMPADEYPTLPASPEPTGTIPGDVFTQAVTQVAVAADRGDTLPILTGVRMQIEGERLTLLATDRYRLAMRELSWHPGRPDISQVVLVPARQLTDTAKALSASGTVELALGGPVGGDGLIGFEAGQRRATTRLLDGDYPKVTSIFPTSVDSEAVVKTSDLIDAVKRVALVAERNTPVRLKFTDGQLTIDAGTGEDAQASEVIDTTLTGPELETAFNPHFLLDGLAAVGTAYTRLSFTQASRPAVISGQADIDAEPDTSYRYVLMPVRFAV